MFNLYYKFAELFGFKFVIVWLIMVSVFIYVIKTDFNSVAKAERDMADAICDAVNISMNVKDFEKELTLRNIVIEPYIKQLDSNQKEYHFMKNIRTSQSGAVCLVLVDKNNVIIKKSLF
ncbi:hypothetical protein [Neisseria sp. Ec49-e6-T10]|uniref:hypothetical protein n=1 Tax=Neisseria sp. Ec49-e6-T10 TaxID=3140744 RepID=UPI003EC052BD